MTLNIFSDQASKPHDSIDRCHANVGQLRAHEDHGLDPGYAAVLEPQTSSDVTALASPA